MLMVILDTEVCLEERAKFEEETLDLVCASANGVVVFLILYIILRGHEMFPFRAFELNKYE